MSMPTSPSEPVTRGNSNSLPSRISLAVPMTRLSASRGGAPRRPGSYTAAAGRRQRRARRRRARARGRRALPSARVVADPHPQLARALEAVAQRREGHGLLVVARVAVEVLGVVVAVDDAAVAVQPLDLEPHLPVLRGLVAELDLDLHVGEVLAVARPQQARLDLAAGARQAHAVER